MQAQIRLGRIFGIEIGLHYSWLIIAVLIATSLAGHFSEAYPNWATTIIWTTAIMTALLFFAAIIVHELSHAAIARLRGLPVRSITLFALGGVAQIGKEAADAKTEFWMGIVGPLTSALIGALCLGIAWTLGWTSAGEPATPVTAMLVWLGYINFGLAIFNMVPGFPMDGGRVLRGVIWSITGNAARPPARLRQPDRSSPTVSSFSVFFASWRSRLQWPVDCIHRWFLLSAAHASTAQAEVIETFRGVRVADLMARDCTPVDGNTNLETFVHEFLLRTGRRCFLVAEKGKFTGLITLNEVKEIPQARWPFTTVYDVMVPLERLRTVTPETPVAEALEILGRENIHQLPVVSNGRLEGMISRDQIMNQLLTRTELKM